MPHMVQSKQIQGSQQKQGGLLGALFNVLSMFPETAMIGQAGNTFLNPSGTNLGNLATTTAKMIGGDKNGDLTSKADEPELEHNAEEERQESPSGGSGQGSGGGGMEIAATDVGGKTPEPVTDESSAEKNAQAQKEDPLSIYANMTMDEVFKMHPELQGMFTQHLYQG